VSDAWSIGCVPRSSIFASLNNFLLDHEPKASLTHVCSLPFAHQQMTPARLAFLAFAYVWMCIAAGGVTECKQYCLTARTLCTFVHTIYDIALSTCSTGHLADSIMKDHFGRLDQTTTALPSCQAVC
jgi:hypothetical protein